MADVKVLNEVGATIIINGVEQEKVTVDYGSTVTWSVSKEGYTTQSGSQVVTEDTTLKVTLSRETYTITIKTSPAGSAVVIETDSSANTYLSDADGEVKITAKWGDELRWTVSHDGYETKSGTHTVTGDDTINVDLSVTQVTFAIEVTLEE